jgi:predicted ArsR family transcriptional regulator
MAKINKRQRPHNAPDTQRESWKQIKDSIKRYTQADRVFEYLKNHKGNSRQLATSLNIERNAMTRTLADLKDDGRIRIAYEAQCPITHRLTQFYEAIDPETESRRGAPQIEGKCIQVDLFAAELNSK